MSHPSPDEQQLELAADYLRKLRNIFPTSSINVETGGEFALLLVAFVWKQEDHAEAILSLGRHRDTQLVARSMIEGLCQLKWAAKDPDERANRWRKVRVCP